MAETANAIVINTGTGRILDHAGAALATFVILTGSVIPPFLRPRGKQMIWANSSGGQALVGAADTGLEGDLDIPLKMLAKDPNNTADVTNMQTIRGLHDSNLTTLTGYGAYNVVSELTNGGPNEGELELTFRDNAGAAHIVTVSVIVMSAEPENSNGVLALNPVFRVTSAIVWS